ncbi:hypothetical protein ACOSQ3_027722 [Xanthoceras sorbifolium]
MFFLRVKFQNLRMKNFLKKLKLSRKRAADFMVGLGAVVRDHQGLFMAGLSRKLVGSISIEVAEATVLLNGIHLAFESGFKRLVVESDAKNLVSYISSNSPHQSEVGLIISDILVLCHDADVVFSFVPRSANYVAHALARNSFTIDDISIWMEDAPPWLFQSLSTDFQA